MGADIEIRNEKRLRVEFTDEDSMPVDPETVKLEIHPPEGTSPAITTLEYGVDDEIEREAEGVYTSLLYVDLPGAWRYTWIAEGVVRGAKSGCFDAYEGCAENA